MEKAQIDERLLDNKMIWLGFRENLTGTLLLREAVEMYRPGMKATKDIYPALAKAHGMRPESVERNMRHAIDKAMDSAHPDTYAECFGWMRGRKPTVTEFVGRMARVCACED